MNMNEDLSSKRLLELSQRAAKRGVWVYSDFLTLAEQQELSRLRTASPYTLEGGFPAAERRLAAFGEGEGAEIPIACLAIEPRGRRFADTLTHREFLGSLMGLGLRREVLGDIVVEDNAGFLFCLDSIAGHIAEQLTEVKRTAVRVTLLERTPELRAATPETSGVIVASERLDALVSAVYDLSRAESQRMIQQGLAAVNGAVVMDVSAAVRPGEIVSIRGLGRFAYEGAEGETRKGRLRVVVRRY